MRKRFVKITALLLSLTMAVSLSACGGSTDSVDSKDAKTESNAVSDESNLNEVGTYPIVKEPIEMSVFTMTMPNVEDLATNDFTKYMEEKTGIKLTFQTGTRDDWRDKLNMALQSGDYPDVILGVDPNLAKYGVKEGVIIQLDDLIEKNMPNYMKMMSQYMDLTRQTDGHIYSIAEINDCYHCMYARKMWVNKKYLDAMGVDIPTTTEEFMEVCKKFKEYKPDGIAIAGANAKNGWYANFEEWMMGSFILDPGKQQAVRDKTAVTPEGKVVCVATDDKYKEGLKYMSELYKQGYIYDGDFTQTQEQVRTLMNQEDEPVLFVPAGTLSDVIDPAENNEFYRDYVAMSPVKGPDGTQITPFFKYSGVDEFGLCITDKCKDPAAALRWVDTFFTETGDLCSQYGAEEGKDWELNPEGEVGLNGKPALYKVLNAYSPDTQNHDWQDIGIRVAPADYRLGQAVDPNVDIGSAEGLEKMLYEASKNLQEPYAQKEGELDIMPQLKLTDQEATDIQTVGVEVEKYIAENQVAFITGQKDLDKDWESFKQGLDNAGLQTLLGVYQTAYERQMGKDK